MKRFQKAHTVPFEADLSARLVTLAQAEDRSVAAVIRNIVKAFLSGSK